MLAVKRAVGEEHGFCQPQHVLQQRWMRREAFEDSGNLWAAEVSTKLLVKSPDFIGRAVFMNDWKIRRLGWLRDLLRRHLLVCRPVHH